MHVERWDSARPTSPPPPRAQSGLCSLGEAKLLSRERAALYGTDKEKELLAPAPGPAAGGWYADLAKLAAGRGVVVDTLVCTPAFVDVFTTAPLASATGGSVRVYPAFVTPQVRARLGVYLICMSTPLPLPPALWRAAGGCSSGGANHRGAQGAAPAWRPRGASGARARPCARAPRPRGARGAAAAGHPRGEGALCVRVCLCVCGCV